MGTAPGAGPKGRGGDSDSDHGMDRVTPRRFDPIGTENDRRPGPESKLVRSNK